MEQKTNSKTKERKHQYCQPTPLQTSKPQPNSPRRTTPDNFVPKVSIYIATLFM